MNKKEYWAAHVKKNPAFENEEKRIEISVKMLHALLDEAYDKGYEQRGSLDKVLRDVFKAGGLNNFRV